MKRPDLAAVLAPLKPFQRRTVDHAFHRLFAARDSSARFLVADEVGLGKTLVARGIIGRTIDHLWNDVDRIDIVYICSNQSIAQANLPKLRIDRGAERSFALATRLTMLATELAPVEGRPTLADSKVNFISFTPATSFQMGNAGGKSNERRVLFHLLEDTFADCRGGLMNLLQGSVTQTERWRRRLNEEPLPLEPGIRRDFLRAFRSAPGLRRDTQEAIERWYLRQRSPTSLEAKRERNLVIAKLRRVLAAVCIKSLEPDLVVLDEFQRFKSLLEARTDFQDPAAELAQALFAETTPEGNPVRTLLLSATPYKLYTTDAEIEHEDHYRDFLDTARFLMNRGERAVQDLQKDLAEFGRALKGAAGGEPVDVITPKRRIENTLRKFIARTERVAASQAHDAMVDEPEVVLSLDRIDIEHYLGADALFRAVGDHDPMPLWKSAPYLANFMNGYRFNERLDECLARSPARVGEVLRSHPGAFLRPSDIHRWRPADPGHPKLRNLVNDQLEGGMWRLLWIPPTLPYWPLDGPFVGQEGRTKALLFSAWNVVPDAVSAMLSYEAERRMVGRRLRDYSGPDRQQRGLLRLTRDSGGLLSRHRLLLLLLPCLRLADHAHPLLAPAGADRRAWVGERVRDLLRGLPDPGEGPVDERWDWAAPLLLDPGLREFLLWWRDSCDAERPNPEVLPDYINSLLAFDPRELGPRPEGLEELLTEIALGSPGIVAARTLASTALPDATRRQQAVILANAFWKLFNRPAVICLVGQLEKEPAADDHSAYWRQVVRYCIQGNLQAVMDEAWHLNWEQRAWSGRESVESVARACVEEIATSVEPRPSRVHARMLRTNGAGNVTVGQIRMRTVMALRFGHSHTEEGMLSQEAVRAAFNSPFRPFVLASTSIGQEGLDFHPWCHRLIHWNLPGNPVDMEQREGRVHRYKGHAVRRNVADRFGAHALAEWRPGQCLWRLLFDRANAEARSRNASDLDPFWVTPGAWRVQRFVPMLPYTRELEQFRRLKRQLAAYRVVFGQPRQQELMALLERSELTDEQLARWVIDLTPAAPAGDPRK